MRIAVAVLSSSLLATHMREKMKLDGQRGQIHANRSTDYGVVTKIFSRHLEDMTDKVSDTSSAMICCSDSPTQYPDIVSLVAHIFSASPDLLSFIVDSEIVAIDPKTGTLRSFQELSNRARKDVQLEDVKVAVCVFAFDLMYLNGEVCLSSSHCMGASSSTCQILIQEPFRRRRELLRAHLPSRATGDDHSARLDHMSHCESANGREALEAFWQESLDLKTEGLMIKVRVVHALRFLS